MHKLMHRNFSKTKVNAVPRKVFFCTSKKVPKTVISCINLFKLYELYITMYNVSPFQLYPSQESSKYTALLSDLTKFSHQSHHGNNQGAAYGNTNQQWPCSSTSQLHSLLFSLVKYYTYTDAVDSNYDDLNVPL